MKAGTHQWEQFMGGSVELYRCRLCGLALLRINYSPDYGLRCDYVLDEARDSSRFAP